VRGVALDRACRLASWFKRIPERKPAFAVPGCRFWFRGLLLPLEQEQQRRKPNPEQGPQAQHRGAWFVGACASAQFTYQTLSGPIFRGALLSFGNAETRAKLLKLLECISIVFPEIVE
jgi:hypothetical protein